MKFVVTAFFLLCTLSFQAQNLEAGLMLGFSNYQGELASKSGLGIGKSHLAGGIFGRYGINDFFSARFGVNFATISADDADVNDPVQKARNLSFKSSILEFALTGEWNILGYQPYALYRTFSPYLFGGIALYHFNPRAKYNDDWVSLQPLGTEGQGLDVEGVEDPYKLLQVSLPVGVGFKYALNDKLNVGLELGIRFTFTDYLDDVSTNYVDDALIRNVRGDIAADLANRSGEVKNTGDIRGDSSDKDRYFIAGLTLSYNFSDNGLVGSRGRGRRKAGCYN